MLVWMCVIFSASADGQSYEHSSRLFVPLIHWLFPRMPDDEVQLVHHIFRKCCHLTEYALLAILVRQALVYGVKNGFPTSSWRLTGGVIGVVFLYAASDEFHQIFVPTRTPLFSDVLIDTAGGAVGLLLFWLGRQAWKGF